MSINLSTGHPGVRSRSDSTRMRSGEERRRPEPAARAGDTRPLAIAAVPAQAPCCAGDPATDIAGPAVFTVVAAAPANRMINMRTPVIVVGIAVIGLLVAATARIAVGVGGAAPAGARAGPTRVSTPALPAPSVGAFTGAYEAGLPVYRLPPLQVTASRKTE